jgi:hypothetical protein
MDLISERVFVRLGWDIWMVWLVWDKLLDGQEGQGVRPIRKIHKFIEKGKSGLIDFVGPRRHQNPIWLLKSVVFGLPMKISLLKIVHQENKHHFLDFLCKKENASGSKRRSSTNAGWFMRLPAILFKQLLYIIWIVGFSFPPTWLPAKSFEWFPSHSNGRISLLSYMESYAYRSNGFTPLLEGSCPDFTKSFCKFPP